MFLGLEKEKIHLKVGTNFGWMLMLERKSIHHLDYTNIQHITQDWFVQLALSGARGEQSPGQFFIAASQSRLMWRICLILW